MIGSASALSFHEQYTGYQSVKEGQSYNFGFDFWANNLFSNVTTDSSLLLTADAEGAFDPWESASLDIDFYSEDWASETAEINLYAWNAAGGTSQTFSLGTISGYLGGWFSGGQTYNFTYNFNNSQLIAFETWGWGNVMITASLTNCWNYNDFGITRVAMAVNTSATPVPEPSTMLLMGIGVLGLVAIGRRKSNRLG
jgi:hypothetical protein